MSLPRKSDVSKHLARKPKPPMTIVARTKLVLASETRPGAKPVWTRSPVENEESQS